MAKPWADVAGSPEFQSLDEAGKQAAQQQYFAQVVAPQVPASDLNAARSQFFSDVATKPAIDENAKAAPFSLKDLALSAGAGGAGGLKALTDLLGVGNVASTKLADIQQAATEMKTPERLAEMARREAIKERAKGNTWEEIKASLGSFAEAPLQESIEALSSSAPIIAGSILAPEVALPAGLARLGMAGKAIHAARSPATAIGAAMGLGSQKGQDYQTVKDEAIARDIPEPEAERLAQKAAEYSLQNAPRQVASTAAGALEGAVGVENVLGKLGKAAPAVEGASKGIKPPGWSEAIGKNVLEEAAPEFIQAATGQLGSNVALQQAGIPTDITSGVLSSALHDALVGGALGGITSPAKMTELRKSYVQDQLAKERETTAVIDAGIKAEEEKLAKTKEVFKQPDLLGLPAPAEEIAPTIDEPVLQNPLGNITPEELGPEVHGYVQKYRADNGMPELKTYSVEDIKDAMTAVHPEGEQGALDAILTAKSGYSGTEKYTPEDVINAAVEKNVASDTVGFKDFLQRTTGSSDLTAMSPPQLFSAFKALKDMPANETGAQIVLPEGTNAQRFKPEQYKQAVDAVKTKFEEAGQPVPIQDLVKTVQETTGLKTERDAHSILNTAIKNEDLTESKTPVFHAVKPDTGEIVSTHADKQSADAVAAKDGLNVQEATQVSVAPSEKAAPRAVLPEGYDIAETTFNEGEKPEAYTITPEGRAKPLATVMEENDVPAKLERLQGLRRTEAYNNLEAATKHEATVQRGRAKLEAMEARGESGTEAYKLAQSRQANAEQILNRRIDGLLASFDEYSAPLTAKPVGKKNITRKGFTVTKEGQKAGTFPTREAAEESILSSMPDKPLEDLVAENQKGAFHARAKAELNRRQNKPTEGKKVSEVHEAMKPKEEPQTAEAIQKTAELRAKLDKMGLQDVGIKIVEAIEAKADGSYEAKLIQIAMDSEHPVRTMRHEAMHALKELGFFTDAQWASLEKMAKTKWVDQYLKAKNAYLPDGRKVTRYEAYTLPKDQGGQGLTESEVLEEAIADAFGDFDVSKAPAGMLTALLNKMRNFFDALGNYLSGRGFESYKDVFGKIEKGELKATKAEGAGTKLSLPETNEPVKKVDPNDVSNIVKHSTYKDAGINVLNSKIEKTSKPLKVDEVGKLFDDAYMAEFGKQGDWRNPTDFRRAVVQAVDELKYQMQQGKSGKDWYDEDIALAFDETEKIIPSLADPQKRAFFSMVAGIMSPSVIARDNWVIAAQAFQHYEKTSVLPARNPANGNLWQGGVASANKEKQLNMFNNMLKPEGQGGMGEKAAIEWLQSSHTVKEINEMRRKYGNMGGIDGKAADLKLGFTAFGPKIGPFVMNINGIHEVTVDVWMTRTFNRYFGQMMGPEGKMIEAPTEPQRVAIKNLAVNVAQQLNVKPYQVQSMLWFYEQQLFNKLGTGAQSYGFSDGAKKFAETQGVGGGKSPASTGSSNATKNGPAGQPSGSAGATAGKQPVGKSKKLSLGVVAEVAPNPDHPTAEQWRQMDPVERLNATTAVAKKVMNGVFDELGLKGYTFKFSTGKYEGEVNPNIIVNAPEGSSIEELDELARVLGYVLDQKAMVTFDEGNKTSDSQSGFVKVRIPDEMSQEDLGKLRDHIAANVPQADGDTLRDGALLYGNFSEYNDSVDTLTDKQYHQSIRDAIESFPYDGAIEVSAPETFHSSYIEPETRSDYLKETRYGESNRLQGRAGTDVRGVGSGRLQAISDEAIALRDRWIDARGAARLGSRSQPNAVSYEEPTAEYGTATPDSTAVTGVHFSKQQRTNIGSAFYGAGLRGLEAQRLNDSANSDIKPRVYFYVDTGKGIQPEAGVGGVPHVIQLNNLYDVQKDPLGIIKGVRGTNAEERANRLERSVMNAGFDGYLTRDPIMNQGFAVLIGKHNIKTNQKFSLRAAPDTPAFKRWFGDSKIVNADGTPKVMYHGTGQDILAFRGKQADAIFLTDDPSFAEKFSKDSAAWMSAHPEEFLTKAELAQGVKNAIAAIRKDYRSLPEGKVMIDSLKAGTYADATAEAQEYLRNAYKQMMPSGPNILPVYVSAKNPFDYQKPANIDKVLAKLDNPDDYADALANGEWNVIESDEVQKAIKDAGFDAFYVQEGGQKNLAVYEPTQIKSATGNNGTYGVNNPDIRYSLRSAEDAFDPAEIEKHAETSYMSKDKLIDMNIDDFLNLSEEGFVASKQRLADERLANGEKYTSLPQMMAYGNGSTLEVTGHEGRHRARALKNAGYKTMPVIFKTSIRYSEQLDPENFDYVADWPTTVRAQEGAANPSFTIKFPFTREQAPDNYQPTPAKLSLRNIADEIKSMPNGNAIYGSIKSVTTTRDEKGFIERMMDAISPESISSIRQKALNRYNQLSVYDQRLAEQMGGAALLADASAESGALLSDLAAGVTAAALGVHNRKGGIPVFRNGVTIVDTSVKGPTEIFSPLAAMGDPEVYQAYQFWAGAKRGSRFLADGKEQVFTPAMVNYAKQLCDVDAKGNVSGKYPEFAQVQKEWIQYNDGLVDYMVATGVLSKEKANEFKRHGDYIPFYRQLDGEKTVGPNIFQSIAGVKPPKALKGSEAPLADFLETVVRNTQAAIQAGMKNTAAQRAVDVAVQIKQAVELPAQSSAPDTVTVLRGGKPVSYQTSDHLFIEAVKSLNLPELPFLGILAGPANLLRNLVTKDPGFMLANLMRDSMSAYVISGANMLPVVDTIKNFGRAVGGSDPAYQALLNAGILGGYEFSQNIEASGEALAKDLRRKTGTQTGFEKIGKPFTSLWGALEKGTEASDAATRMAVYKDTLARTGNEAEALARALEVMNFNRKGSSAVVRVLTAAIPFLNARMQGLDVFYRAAFGRMGNQDAAQIKRSFFIRGATLASLSVMYWALTHDDDDYKKQEQETKDNNWLIPSMKIKIPIPFEVGILFKVIPERLAAYAFGNDTGKDLSRSMGRALTSTFGIAPPQVVLPYLEAKTNYSFYTGRPIVGQGLEGVAPEYQVGPGTSPIFQKLGKELGASPMMLEHMFKGYTGSMGMYLVDLMDAIGDVNSNSPKASKRFEQMPVIKRFALDPEARGTVTSYYELKKSVDETVRTYNLLERTGSEELGEYTRENAKLLMSRDFISSMDKSLKEIQDMTVAVRSSPMSGDAKREIQTNLTRAANSMTANIQNVRKAVE